MTLELLRYESAAEFLDLSVRTLKTMVKQNRIPHIRYAKNVVRFNRDDLLEWIEEHKVLVTQLRKVKKPSAQWVKSGLKRHGLETVVAENCTN